MIERRPVPIETDALGAIRLELIGAARRRAAARRRRRQMVATVATGLTMLVAVTGVSAVSGFSTGVPVIDNVLGHQHGEQEVAGPQGGEFLAAPPGVDLRPAPGGTSEALDLPWPDGSLGAKGVGFLSMTGEVCVALASDPHRHAVARARAKTGCTSPDAIADKLTDQPAFITHVTVGDPTIVIGYAAEDVQAVHVDGPSGTFESQLTKLWTPNTPEAETMRIFAAVGDVGLGTDGISPEESGPFMDFRNYAIDVLLEDGRRVGVENGGF